MQSTMISATSTISVDDFLLTELEEVAAVVKKLPYLNAGKAFRSILRPALTGREGDVLAHINSKLPSVSVDFVKKGSAEKVEAGDENDDDMDEDVDDIVAAHHDLFFYEQESSQEMASASTTPILWKAGLSCSDDGIKLG
ncbi:hypothetical protein VNI00_008428 [Paramarasmius palmivorus]|uniref:Uncharacterized protein n=1 Tax=Paramarasmius palmivorus TaxID=297713 RepID=A0AAW0CVJ1_9AGAR